MKSKIIFSALVFITLIGMACVSAGDIDDFSHSNALESDISIDGDLIVDDVGMPIDGGLAVDDVDVSIDGNLIVDDVGMPIDGGLAVDDDLDIADDSNELAYGEIDDKSSQSDHFGENHKSADDGLADSLNEPSSTLSSEKDKNRLGDGDPLNFLTLSQHINSVLYTGHVDLENNYRFNLNTDAVFALGISISSEMNVIIDGHGHSVDGAMQAALFRVVNSPSSITFRNINFMNAGFSDAARECYENEAPHGGGNAEDVFNAVRIVKSNVIFSNCSFQNNQCPVYGAVNALQNSRIRMLNCYFNLNTAQKGAAITFDYSCRANIIGSNFTNNNAKQDGGAIFIKSKLAAGPSIDISGCRFTKNAAGGDGGALFNDGAYNLIINNTRFSANRCSGTGGAIYSEQSLSLLNSNITNNTAEDTGGVYLKSFNPSYADNPLSPYGIFHCRLIGNEATVNASDLYINFKDAIGDYVFQENYIKNSYYNVPSVFIQSEGTYSQATLRIKHNSFIPFYRSAEFPYCFMKFEDMQVKIEENWWGENDPSFSGFYLMVNGAKVVDPDNTPLFIYLDQDVVYSHTENIIPFKAKVGKNGYKDTDFFPWGVRVRVGSKDGVIRAEKTADAKWNIHFTPDHEGVVRFRVIVDNLDVTVEVDCEKPSNWKKVITWTAGFFSLAISVILAAYILDDDDDPDETDDDIVYFTSIEDAIKEVPDGSAIIIPPGVYRGRKNVGLNINKNLIFLSDCNKAGDVIIDGEGKSWIWNISATNITILGLTFTNGQTSGDGAALRFNSPLDNSTIVANFINNRAANGGAIYFGSTGGNITYSEFSSNQATYDGGAVYFSDGGKIGNVKFSYNKADRGGAIFQIGDLSKSNITYVSNSAKEGTNIFVVGGDDPNLGISVSDVTEGQPVFMEITTVAGYFGVVFVEINNARYDVNLVNGYGNLTVNSLRAGIYRVYVTFRGSEKYKISHITTEFEVHKKEHINPDLKISVANVTFGHPVLVEITALSNYSNNVSVMLNFNASKIYTVKVVNGYGNVSIENLAVGNYTAIAFSDAIGDFDAGSDFTNFEVSADDGLIDPNLIINVINPGADAPIVIEIFTNSTYSGNLRIQIDPLIDYIDNIKKGYKKITLNGMFGGVYTLTVTLYSTDVFKESTVSMEFEVEGLGLSALNPYGNVSNIQDSVSMPVAHDSSSAKEKTIIAAKSRDYVINYGGKCTVTLKDAKGNSISNREITFLLAGKSIGSVKTNSKGVAAIKLSPKVLKKIKAGKRKLVVKFAGDNEYDQASKTVKVALNKEKAKLLAKKKAFKRALKIKRYVVRLKDSKGKAIKKAKLTLRLKGKTYKAKTNKKGKAVFKIKKLSKKGKYQVKLKFKGNKYYNAVSKKAKIAVK